MFDRDLVLQWLAERLREIDEAAWSRVGKGLDWANGFQFSSIATAILDTPGVEVTEERGRLLIVLPPAAHTEEQG